MRQLFTVTISFLFLITCNNNSSNPSQYILYPDSTNYEYKLIKPNLLKVVRFFPGTKDTNVIYFLDIKHKIKDSTSYYFDKQGKITDKIKYEDNMNIRRCQNYYKNGNIKQEFTIKGKHISGNIKSYYNSGELKPIKEIIVYKDSIEYLNNIRYYDNNGKLNTDSTNFVEILCPKDTISITDSLKIRFNVIIPRNIVGLAYKGSFDKNFNTNFFYEKDLIKDTVYYYKPKKYGQDSIEIIFLFKDKKNNRFWKSYLKKKVFVTK